MTNPSRSRQILALVGWLLLTFAAPLASIRQPPDAWYDTLVKPWFNPPSWIFGPVWTLLYFMMAIAAWLVWKRGGWAEQRTPLVLYLVQLALNAVWTPLFFGLHRIDLALVIIIALWLTILMTMAAFWFATRVACALFVPYFAWVSFASLLNFALWRLNS